MAQGLGFRILGFAQGIGMQASRFQAIFDCHGAPFSHLCLAAVFKVGMKRQGSLQVHAESKTINITTCRISYRSIREFESYLRPISHNL